jgi:AcrR family transcriptional regulator
MELSDNNEIRGQIVVAAKNVFGKFGYKKTTMDEIGIAARKGKTALYYYFKNKEDVFRAVVEKEALELQAAIFKSIEGHTSPVEKLKAYFLVRMNTLLNVSNFYDAMKNELLDQLQFINQIRIEVDKAELELVKGILIEGVKKNCFEIKDVETTANVLVTLLKGLEIPFFTQKKYEHFETHVNFLFDILCHGIVKRCNIP